MRLAVPDLISNSYFPAVAAVELGFFEKEGLAVALELIFPVDKAYEALRDGRVDFVAGSAHSALAAFPEWEGVKLLAAQAQGMYWFLVLHADLGAKRGDIAAVRGRHIGAAPWVEMGLIRLLAEAGIDLGRDRVRVAPVPGSAGGMPPERLSAQPLLAVPKEARGSGDAVNFGLLAAQALEERKIDGFWANGMAAELAVRRGVGTVLLDVRRGDGPKAGFHYTMAALAARERLVLDSPQSAAAAVRALVAAQRALKEDVTLAAEVGRRLFPPEEASIIAQLVRRDLPFYDAAITPPNVAGMNRFCREVGILKGDPPYEKVVAVEFAELWQG